MSDNIHNGPSPPSLVKPDDAQHVALPSAEEYNKAIRIIRAYCRPEIEGYQAPIFSEGNVKFVKDKKSDNDPTQPTTQQISIKEYTVVSVGANYLACYPYDSTPTPSDVSPVTLGSFDSSQIVYIAKYWDMQLDYWDLRLIDGYSYEVVFDGLIVLRSQIPSVRRVRTSVSQPLYSMPSRESFTAGVTQTEMVWPPYNVLQETAPGSGIFVLGSLISAFDLSHPIQFPDETAPDLINGGTMTVHQPLVSKMELPSRIWVPVEKTLIVCDGGTKKRVNVRMSDSYPI